jgi:hypothetical protein
MRLSSALCGALLVPLGCSDHDAVPAVEASFEPLALADDWSAVTPDDDPLVEDLEQVPACQAAAFWIEPQLDWIEIDSGICNWVTLRAAARAPVAPGTRLALTVSHYDLVAGAPAEATLRLVLGECEAWSKTLSIPADAAVYEEQLDAPCALDEGATILFHVHNHGQNSYQLQQLSALREPPR